MCNLLALFLSSSQQAQAEQEEEFISNTLLKKINLLKKEKETLALNYEQEEEFLTNDLSRKLAKVGEGPQSDKTSEWGMCGSVVMLSSWMALLLLKYTFITAYIYCRLRRVCLCREFKHVVFFLHMLFMHEVSPPAGPSTVAVVLIHPLQPSLLSVLYG